MKEKIIEEMAKAICGKYNNGGCEIDGYVCNLRCDSRIRAEICYEQGYRKIRENEVVLTDDEYERWQGQTLNIKKVRKETVEKFAERLKDFFKEKGKIFYNGNQIHPNLRVVTLEKIDEICKEITEGKV